MKVLEHDVCQKKEDNQKTRSESAVLTFSKNIRNGKIRTCDLTALKRDTIIL